MYRHFPGVFLLAPKTLPIHFIKKFYANPGPGRRKQADVKKPVIAGCDIGLCENSVVCVWNAFRTKKEDL
jgi:hypothetical protein